MSSLRLERLPLLSAELGPSNPLPPIGAARDLHKVEISTSGLPPQMARNLRYGRVGSVLPYLDQDDYGRKRRVVETPIAVLENERLRATVLLDYGGRLWSLVDRADGRELLFTNPVFQPANLALRNAWFAGGVEWNPGTIGHSPLTCDPVHAGVVAGPDAEPILRLWEWERLRNTPFQIDLYLPPSSAVLYVRVRISNPNEQTVPMYWWTNMAVPEVESTQVLASATAAYEYGYGDELRYVSYPRDGGKDLSFPARQRWTEELFFDVPTTRQAWIAAVDGVGRGVLHTSTGPLRGRKLFAWGTGVAGRNWERLLSDEARPYIEIQAGLTTTQLEHIPLAAHGSFEWLEAIAPLQLGEDQTWEGRTERVGRWLGEELAPERLGLVHEHLAAVASTAPSKSLHRGSGWGALEQAERASAGRHVWSDSGTPFDPETLGSEQQPWMSLITDGELPQRDVLDAPSSYVAGEAWQARLEASPPSWQTLLHLGVIYWANEHSHAARQAWMESLSYAHNPWALRNLARLDQAAGDHEAAAGRYREALAMRPDLRPLVIEAVSAHLMAGLPEEALSLIDAAPADIRALGRVRLLEAFAALGTGDVSRAMTFFTAGVVLEDLREGDHVLEELWAAIEAASGRAKQRPLPEPYRFRMRPVSPLT